MHPRQMHYYLPQWVEKRRWCSRAFIHRWLHLGNTTQWVLLPKLQNFFRNCFNTCQRAKGILPSCHDTSLTLCKHKKKLKASRQLSEEIFRLHFIIFHYHCFTDAFTAASSRLWNMIISCKFWPICRWAVSANIQNINKPHLPMSVQLPDGWLICKGPFCQLSVLPRL